MFGTFVEVHGKSLGAVKMIKEDFLRCPRCAADEDTVATPVGHCEGELVAVQKAPPAE